MFDHEIGLDGIRDEIVSIAFLVTLALDGQRRNDDALTRGNATTAGNCQVRTGPDDEIEA